MSIVENLNRIKSCKESIKQAIIDKGVDMTDIPFEGYAAKIAEISGSGEPEVPADFDYLSYRQNMTSYSNDDPACYPSDYTFCGCPNLQTVDLPNASGFGMGCFKNCNSLTSANIPNVFAISDEGFIDCQNLTSIDLPNCISIGTNAFMSCLNLQTVNIPNCLHISHGSFANSGVSSIDSPNCNRIESSAFQTCNNLTSVNIPNCTFIGDYAFDWDMSLQELIATEIKTINNSAFSNCNLPSIDIPKCTQIGDNAFYQNFSLTSVNAPNCGKIGQTAFTDCNILTTLDLRNVYFCNLAGTDVFTNTPFMNGEGTIYVNAASLDKYKSHFAWSAFADRFVGVGDPDVVLLAFEDGRVYGDTTMLFDGFVDYLGISTDMVISIDLPNVSETSELASWGGGMFANFYNNLQEVSIGKIEAATAHMFNSCQLLTTINLPECKNVNEYAFSSCINLKTVNLPKCEEVMTNAFYSCTNLNDIDLPNCNNVGSYAFQDCGVLFTANLPKCVVLGENAFMGCNNMRTLTIGTETDQVCVCCVGSLPDSLTAIFVPEHLVDAYKNDWWWGQYAHKIFAVGTEPIIPDTPDTPSNLSEWYVVGYFNGWTIPDPNTQMIIENDWYILRNLTVDGQGVIFGKGLWEDQRHVVGDFTGVGEAVSLAFEGADIVVPAGTYDVYLNSQLDTAYFMEVGQTPF